MNGVLLALGLTLLTGLATGIGSLIAFFATRTNYRFLSVSTGFSAGVMLYVSFVEIFVKGGDSLREAFGNTWGDWVNVGAFFGGIGLIALIDNLIPSSGNPHETHPEKETAQLNEARCPQQAALPSEAVRTPARLLRMGLLTALALGIHNFPEGLATFLAALHEPNLGIAIAVAIALHNIPEGISVSVPIYYATGSRKRALVYSLLSGLAEPVGALVAYVGILVLFGGSGDGVPFEVMGVLFAGVAGIMVYISLDQLLPTSRAYGKGHDSLLGLLGGMAVMALSLLLM